MMLAWGWAAGRGHRATGPPPGKLLARSSGLAIEPAGHSVLGDLFLQPREGCAEGRVGKPGLPADLRKRIDALPYLARYSVDRLASIRASWSRSIAFAPIAGWN